MEGDFNARDFESTFYCELMEGDFNARNFSLFTDVRRFQYKEL